MKGEMTIRDIAGFCPEEAVWKMMADVSAFMIKESEGCYLNPDSVIIDGEVFMVEAGQGRISEFLAPEHTDTRKPDEKEMVWALGAVAYFMATGHVVFGGHGSSYQKDHPSVSLPVLFKGMEKLTAVLQKCLCYKPERRIGIEELNAFSMKALADCRQQQRMKMNVEGHHEQKREVYDLAEKWPEEMVEV